mgnify:CR=1 FL=1
MSCFFYLLKRTYNHSLLSSLIFLLCLCQQTKAQNKPSWFYLSHDNDLFAFSERTDRYYSFGANIEYAFLTQAKDSLNHWNQFLSIAASIKGFTPDHLDEDPKENLVRPFLAHSSFILKKIKQNEKYYISYGVQVGASGRLINAGSVQNWIHENISGDQQVDGWENQIGRKFTLHLLHEWRKEIKTWDRHHFYIGSEESVGNLFTYLAPSLSYQFHSKSKNNYFPNHYRRASKGNLSLEAAIGFRYEFFNAALRGELFDQVELISKDDIRSLLLTAEFEIRYDLEKVSFFYANYFNTRRVKENHHHIYGTLGMSFKFE